MSSFDMQPEMTWMLSPSHAGMDVHSIDDACLQEILRGTASHMEMEHGGGGGTHAAGLFFPPGWTADREAKYPPLLSDAPLDGNVGSPASSPGSFSSSSPGSFSSSPHGSLSSCSPHSFPCSPSGSYHSDSGASAGSPVPRMDFESIIGKFDADPLVLSVMQEGAAHAPHCVISVEAEADECTRPRKRKRLADGSAEAARGIQPLSKEVLGQMSSEEYEQYMKEVQANHKLSDADRKLLSAERRQIKNREYAQQARKKKKQAQEELHRKIDELEHENARLKQEVSSLKGKVIELVGGMRRMRSLLPNEAAADGGGGGGGAAASLQRVGAAFAETVGRFGSMGGNGSAATAGMALFVVLLSVGLFFHGLDARGRDGVLGGVGMGSGAHTGRVILEAEGQPWWREMFDALRRNVLPRSGTRGPVKMEVVTTTTTTTTLSSLGIDEYQELASEYEEFAAEQHGANANVNAKNENAATLNAHSSGDGSLSNSSHSNGDVPVPDVVSEESRGQRFRRHSSWQEKEL